MDTGLDHASPNAHPHPPGADRRGTAPVRAGRRARPAWRSERVSATRGGHGQRNEQVLAVEQDCPVLLDAIDRRRPERTPLCHRCAKERHQVTRSPGRCIQSSGRYSSWWSMRCHVVSVTDIHISMRHSPQSTKRAALCVVLL